MPRAVNVHVGGGSPSAPCVVNLCVGETDNVAEMREGLAAPPAPDAEDAGSTTRMWTNQGCCRGDHDKVFF